MEKQFEEKIVGTLIMFPHLIKECYLQPKHFFDPNLKIIFCKILDFDKKGLNVSAETIGAEFKNDEYLLTMIMYCLEGIFSPQPFAYFQEKQEELYKSTSIANVVQDYVEKNIEYADMIGKIKEIDNECGSNSDNNNDMLKSTEIFDLITTESGLLEFKKYAFMQNLLKLPKNTMHIIAARTSQGKSAFALNLLNDLAKTYKCLYFNMEMTEKEMYQRLVSINCGVPIEDFYKYETNQKAFNGIGNGISELKKRKIKIYQGSKNIKALRTIMQKESRQEHCVVFIDYVGYVYSNKSNQSDKERIGEVVRDLQLMTKDLDITIFLIAQINREGTEAPTLINLKDSGELEQSAHAVMIIHNPDKDITNQHPIVELSVPKNRDGALCKINLQFDKPTQSFNPIRKL